MLDFPKKLVDAVADVTLGTAIVMLHVLLAERVQQRQLRSTGDSHADDYRDAAQRRTAGSSRGTFV